MRKTVFLCVMIGATLLLAACGGAASPAAPSPSDGGDSGSSNPGSTPVPAFAEYVGVDNYLMQTTQDVGLIPARSRVRISHVYYDGTTMLYGIVAEDGRTTAEAREDQLAVAPPATPTQEVLQ